MYNFSLCLINQHTTNTYRGMEIHLLSTTLDGGTLSTSCPSPFTLWERVLGTHLVGCWKVPGLVWMLRSAARFSCSCLELNHSCWVIYPATKLLFWLSSPGSHIEPLWGLSYCGNGEGGLVMPNAESQKSLSMLQ
jgi:hypothetical protein